MISRTICYCSVCVAGFTLSHILGSYKVRLPYCMDVALVAVIFYALGNWWKHYETLNKKNIFFLKGFLLLFIGVGTGILNMVYMKKQGYSSIKVDMLLQNYGFPLLFVISATLIIIGLYILSVNATAIYSFPFLCHIGRNSMLIMIVHLYIDHWVYIILNKFGVCNALAQLFLTAAFSYVLSIIIERYLPELYNLDSWKKKRNTNT